MTVLAYNARPAPPPARVYCDSSFLFDMFGAASPQRLLKYPAPKRARAINARDFFVWARQQGVTLVTSVLALEEIYRLVLFTPINGAAKAAGLNDWKKLRVQDPATFQAKLAEGRGMLNTFHRFFVTLHLPLVLFGRTRLASEDRASARIARYARILLFKFSLDAMDACHIAIARFCGIDWAATSDADWAPVPTINVIGAV